MLRLIFACPKPTGAVRLRALTCGMCSGSHYLCYARYCSYGCSVASWL